MSEHRRVHPDDVGLLGQAILDAAEVARLGITITRDDGSGPRRIYVNEPAAEIFGYSAEELIGSEAHVTYPPEEKERMHELAARALRGEAVPSVETAVLRKNGTRVPVSVSFSAVQSRGRPAGVAFWSDIADRKKTEDALSRSEARFRELIEAAPDAIGVVCEGRFVYANPAHLALFGRTRDELIGRRVADFLEPDEAAVAEERWRVVLSDGEASGRKEYRVRRPDGLAVIIEMSNLIRIDFEGTPGVLGFARDVTGRREAQAQRIHADRMATLGVVAAGLAHEINNPTAYARLNLASLERELDGLSVEPATRERIAEMMRAAREGVARVSEIVRDLRGFSSPSTEVRWPVDVREVVESAINLATHATRGRVRVVGRFESVPPLGTNPTRLGHVFLNLLLNGAEAFEGGDESTNELRIVVHSPGPDRVLVEVTDNGPGIPEENLERIFEPFFTTKVGRGGTGLGLSICQSSLTELRGAIRVESTLGVGTTFTVSLPVGSPPDGAP